MTDAHVAADLRDGRILISPYYATGGPWRMGYPVVVMPDDASAEELGAAIRFALTRSGAGAPSGANARPLLLKAAGARNESQFMSGAESVSVDATDRTITVTPMRNRGPREGFDFRADAAVVLEDPADDALGAAVRSAWPEPAREDTEDQSEGPALVRDIQTGADWIAAALDEDGYRADFSPASLAEVDRFFDDNLRRPGHPKRRGRLAEDLGARLFALGGYIGEVVRRSMGGHWDAEGLTDEEEEDAVRLVLPDGAVVWPVQRAMKRYELGPEEGIAAWGVGVGLR